MNKRHGYSAMLCICLICGARAGELTTEGLTVLQDGGFYGEVEILKGTMQTNDMKVYYSLDASGATVTDESGNGNTGTVTGPVWTNASQIAGGYVFDGVNDYIHASDAASLDIQAAFTLSIWARQTTTNATECLIMKHDDSSARAYGMYTDGGRIIWQISSSGTGSQLYECRTTNSVSLGNWSHVVATWDGTPNANGKIYVNSVSLPISSSYTAFSGTNIYNSAQPFRVGAKSNGGRYFTGTLDDARVYARALTAAEVKSLYNNAFPNYGITNVLLTVDGAANIKRLVAQGDIGMGGYTNGP